MGYPYTLPKLEDRFLPPENWEAGQFENPETNHTIHYSQALIKAPKGSVICLPGLSEFSEKYIETAKFFNNQGYNFFVIDWAFQGRSTRLESNQNKRHSHGYDSDVSDLDFFITKVIKTNTDLYMLAHSMGGHIGLRYLATRAHKFRAASFSTPMLGIKSLRYFPCSLACLFSSLKEKYVPGGKDWFEQARKSDGTDIFSSDPKRDQIHQSWSKANPELRIGNATFKWLCESLKSIGFLKKKSTLEKIDIPILFAYADKETLVDNRAVIKAARKIKKAKLLKLKGAKHELLMETDDIRDKFLKKTLEVFNQ
jgi:lysophospholipase